MPTFSPDGKDVYFIRDGTGKAKHTGGGVYTWFDMETPELVRVRRMARRTGPGRERRIRDGRETWFYWMRQPSVSPERDDDRGDVRRAEPARERRRRPEPAIRRRGRSANRKRRLRTRSPGPRVGAGRPLPRVRQERPGRRPRRAPDPQRGTRRTAACSRSPGPGYLAPAWSPDSKYLAATKTDSFGTDVVILDVDTGAELLRLTNDQPLVLAGLVAGRRRDRVPRASTARSSTSSMVKLDGHGRPVDGRRGDAPDRGLRARRRVAAGLVHPAVGAAGHAAAHGCAISRRSGLDRPVTGTADATAAPAYLDRLAARSAADAHRPVPRASTRIRRRCPPGSRATSRASSGSPGSWSRRPRRTRPRSSRTSRSSRRSGPRGWRHWSGSGRRSRRTLPVVMDAKRGDIGSTAARQAVALYDALGADAVTVNPYLGEEAIAPLLERVDRLRLRAVPDVEPRRRRAPDRSSWARTRARDDAGTSRSGLRVARRRDAWGPGGTVGLVVGATAPGRARRDPGRRARAAVPRPGRRRPGRRRSSRCSPTGRRRRRRPAARPAAGCSSTCRAASRRRRPDWTPDDRGRGRASTGPPPSGLRASLCYPSRRARPDPTRLCRHGTRADPALMEHSLDAAPVRLRMDRHPGHRAPDPRPRQAPRRRRGASARASASSARRRRTSRRRSRSTRRRYQRVPASRPARLTRPRPEPQVRQPTPRSPRPPAPSPPMVAAPEDPVPVPDASPTDVAPKANASRRARPNRMTDADALREGAVPDGIAQPPTPGTSPSPAPAPAASDDGKVMSLVDHLTELRNRLCEGPDRGGGVSVVGSWHSATDHRDPRRPAGRTAPQPRAPATRSRSRLRVSLVVGVILAMPVILYQLWAFIAPGLTATERRADAAVDPARPAVLRGRRRARLLRPAVRDGTSCSASPTRTFEHTLGGRPYFDFVTTMFLAFGIVMEFPIVLFAPVARRHRHLGPAAAVATLRDPRHRDLRGGGDARRRPRQPGGPRR